MLPFRRDFNVLRNGKKRKFILAFEKPTIFSTRGVKIFLVERRDASQQSHSIPGVYTILATHMDGHTVELRNNDVMSLTSLPTDVFI